MEQTQQHIYKHTTTQYGNGATWTQYRKEGTTQETGTAQWPGVDTRYLDGEAIQETTAKD